MIKIEDLYVATNKGLDIILSYYPAARECVGQNNKHFKRRANEDDASACLKVFNTPEGEVYKVTDFGDQGTAMSPIDICMMEEGIPFKEAIVRLAERYNVRDELNRVINKPEIRKRAATPEEKDGTRFFELEEKIPPCHLAVMSAGVTQHHAESLHWHLAKSISYVKNREVITKHSTDSYPIFIRECVVEDAKAGEEPRFYKIYEPLNPDKQYRFSYTPTGAKPKRYVNGLFELRKAWREYNATEESLFNSDPRNENKPFKEKKLKEAFICSGERDALCVRAFEGYPLWFNSETYQVSPSEIRDIYQYVDVLYNIPDIDSTGMRKGRELALKYIDIHTIWLPDWLRNYKDNRGKRRKDLRDYVEIRPKKSDFNNLMQLAMPARFWAEVWQEKTQRYRYDVDSACLHYFLKLNGFCALADKNIDDVQYVRVQGNMVSRIKAKDIRRFLFSFAEERALPRPVRNLLLNSSKLSNAALEHMQEVEIDFTNYTPSSQLFFFGEKCYEVSREGVKERPETGAQFVWEENVLPHKIELLSPMFSYNHRKSAEGIDLYDLEVLDTSSPLFGYVINTSRIHWRKELEYALESYDIDQADAYRNLHKFAINGELLTEEERTEQKLNLLSKLFTIGYMMHRYKSPSQAWAPYAMDNKIGEDGECNGRTGKSFLFRALSYFIGGTVKLSGRKSKLMEDNHVFQQVTKHTNMVLIDDCNKYLDTGLFYDCITSDVSVNPKNLASYTIPFEESPKLAFTTNYVPREFDPSSEGRLLYLVFSDYYHQKADGNDYQETRRIYDDFGKNLQSDYSEAEWNADSNFLFQCLQFYLSMIAKGVKIQPPMDNIMMRKFKADMGGSFEEWAEVYFAEDGENVNKLVLKENARNAFKMHSDAKCLTAQRFSKALKAYCEYSEYIQCLNPPQLMNGQGRIIRRNIEDKSTEYIYLQTVGAEVDDSNIERAPTIYYA